MKMFQCLILFWTDTLIEATSTGIYLVGEKDDCVLVYTRLIKVSHQTENVCYMRFNKSDDTQFRRADKLSYIRSTIGTFSQGSQCHLFKCLFSTSINLFICCFVSLFSRKKNVFNFFLNIGFKIYCWCLFIVYILCTPGLVFSYWFLVYVKYMGDYTHKNTKPQLSKCHYKWRCILNLNGFGIKWTNTLTFCSDSSRKFSEFVQIDIHSNFECILGKSKHGVNVLTQFIRKPFEFSRNCLLWWFSKNWCFLYFVCKFTLEITHSIRLRLFVLIFTCTEDMEQMDVIQINNISYRPPPPKKIGHNSVTTKSWCQCANS